ncbi:MAG: hypothetical protein ACX94C_00580 [Phycisphaerales bacterium]
MMILVGAVSAWLCGALVGPHALSVGGEAFRTPGGPQPVWIGIGDSGIVASEQREGGGDDGGAGLYVWSGALGAGSAGGASASGGVVGACSLCGRVLWVRGPPA